MAEVENVENDENFDDNCKVGEQQMQSNSLVGYDDFDNKEQIFDYDTSKFDGFCTDDDADEMEYDKER